MTKAAREAANIIRQKAPGFIPKVTVVLGSGLGGFAECIKTLVAIPYVKLPGFHTPQVVGHRGHLVLGEWKGVPLICLQGRAHYYEGIDNNVILTMVRTCRLLGCDIWLATNAVGSMRADIGPGRLAVITDHVNWQGRNPLVGLNDEAFGERFTPMEEAYDPELRRRLFAIAQQQHIALAEGVYVGVLGPSYETPAEIRAFRQYGDFVGMSTVSEVIAARHCGMRVAVLSVVTNSAAGIDAQKINHTETLRVAQAATEQLTQLVLGFIETLT
ncbi:MAG: purine-nucleoside phosphorylase [Gammaproteobacteria bacterium RIFCSPHIGHO2_12_FULL_45_9]|nr:MAG: purine-nucleoside phosphorylase [Gammaproteobacteria bacterium RIFCSPHIGHO2_12_FULL_45_9]